MSSKNSKDLNILSLSDIHLGHDKTKAKFITDNLRSVFISELQSREIDLVFIVGDFYDRLLSLPNADVYVIDSWIAWFLSICESHDITVVVLEGTPSHDWKQSKRFLYIKESLDLNCDVRYIDSISIEIIDKYGITILGIPDEITSSTDNTFEIAKQLIESRGLDKVDFTLIHGTMDFQLPEHIKTPKHNTRDYLSITKHYVMVGHVHSFGVFDDRCISHGSFDRLAQNEEMPKGMVGLTISAMGNSYRFIENKSAKIYKKIYIDDGMDMDMVLTTISKVVDKLPPDSYVRIDANKGNPILSSIDHLCNCYPLLNWNKKTLDTAIDNTVKSVAMVEDEYVAISITQDNIVSLVKDKLDAINADAVLAQESIKLLESLMR